MEKYHTEISENSLSIALGAFKAICWHVVKAISIMLVLIGLAIAIPTLIAADILTEWINDK
jgi:hypothetical protein